MEYISKNHSKYLIMVHLIFVCKYRKHLLVPFGTQIKELMFEKADEKIKFQISFPFLEEILQQAFDLEFEKVKKGLPGYLILETN